MPRSFVFRIRNFFKTKIWVRITVIVAALVIAGPLIWIYVVTPRITCGMDVKRVDGQCIGVTDGQVALSADLADVLGKIKNENDRVGEDAKAVSVAYLIPLPKSSDDELATLIHHELEGAYVAQFQANESKTLGGPPHIRLLVANSGDESSQQQQVVSDLLAKVNGSERLVTVVVTGKSKRETIDAIDALRRGGVPVVTSRLAGDSLTNMSGNALAHVKGGLTRLAPTGYAEAAAAAAYLKPIVSSVLIVRDTNPDDRFLQSLDDGFRQNFQDDPAHAVVPPRTVLEPTEKYSSALDGFQNTMFGILGDICQQRPGAIFFAGRSLGLAAFVRALPRRPCLDLPINIVTGGDAVEFANMTARGDQQIQDSLSSKVSVKYAAQAHPKSWDESPGSFNEEAIKQFKSNFNQLLSGESLEDGMAIIGYDAIITTVTAIRHGEGGINDKPDLISQEFNRIHGARAILGASGYISLGGQGIPRNRAVVILEVKPDGTQNFVKLTSEFGSPCVPNKTPC
jgi:hypothetical protein